MAPDSPDRDRPRAQAIAVIEDDEGVRWALTKLLTACRHAVRAFGSAEAFLDETPEVGCAIVDVQLPGMTGIDLEQRLNTAGRHVPVIFISAIDDAAVRDAMRRRGHQWLQKPFDETALFAAISRATGTGV
jgi:FixJ family two-component response regulator